MSYDQNQIAFLINLFYESLGQEMVLSRLKHLDALLILLQIMKVSAEPDEETEW